MNDETCEVNFDALVGPTHNYAGLAYGNVASQRSKLSISNPRAAALEGLRKMKLVADLGVKQAVLPPQDRPDVAMLRSLGFAGDDARVLQEAYRMDGALVAACSSASSMWAANAATVSPGADSGDGRVHFTAANLVSQFHRTLEVPTTAAVLRAIFPEGACFAHHAPLPSAALFADEGAANHLRLTMGHGSPGVEVFVYGRCATSSNGPQPGRFPARQTREASMAVVRLHQLEGARTLFVQQHPAAIDAGVFHNDVIAVANLNALLYHEMAFCEGEQAIDQMARCFQEVCGGELHAIKVSSEQVSLADAVDSYLFNSQLVSLAAGGMALVAPAECLEYPSTRRWLNELAAGGTPIRQVCYAQVRQSMRNGGGPACLRLRVALTARQLAEIRRSVVLTDSLYQSLCAWVRRHYREELAPGDLADPALLRESRTALDELTRILQLDGIYPFQQ